MNIKKISNLLIMTFMLLGCSDGYESLIKNDLSNWEKQGGEGVYILSEEGIIDGTIKNSSTTYLCTKETFADFELIFDVLCEDGFNSGVQIRSRYMTEEDARKVSANMGNFGRPGPAPEENQQAPPAPPAEEVEERPAGGGGFMDMIMRAGKLWGPQIEVEVGDRNRETGEIMGEAGYVFGENMFPKFWLSDEKTMKPNKLFKSNEWNNYRVVCQGKRIQTWVNGVQVEDMEMTDEDYATHPSGVIGLQLHGGAGGHCAWKNIKIKKL